MRVLLPFFVLLALPVPAAAQPSAPLDGLYEDFPSIFMEPSVPLAAAPTALPRWVDVRTSAGVTTVTFEPDARVVWRITWGAHGPDEKVTLVDGEEWTRSRFGYDASGELVRKTVTGPGVASATTFAYQTDPATHEVRTRTATLTGGPTPGLERVAVVQGAHDVTVSLTRAGVLLRRDRYDPQHRLLETRWFREGHESARLTYVRDAHGRLRVIRRRIGAHRGTADASRPDTTLESADVAALALAPMERHEATLLLGSPHVLDDQQRGVQRRIVTDFAPGSCWLNQISGLQFDATGLLVTASTACICGFCVAASVPLDEGAASDALGRQEHWTAGPWVRIDGWLDVTADHELVTPSGPRAAGSLAPGDVVRAADGSDHILTSIELLADDGPRLGVNLMTDDGTFVAGGLVFVSEGARACGP